MCRGPGDWRVSTLDNHVRLALSLTLALALAAMPAPVLDRLLGGVVADESGGVLPGVTGVATGNDGVVLATAVTDGEGRYELGPIADGRVTVTFQLDGFETVKTQAALTAGTDTVANQRLAVAK